MSVATHRPRSLPAVIDGRYPRYGGGESGSLYPFLQRRSTSPDQYPHTNFGNLLRYWKDCGCKGIGEVMPNLPFLDSLVQNLFQHVQDVGFPLIFDITNRVGWGYGLVDSVVYPRNSVFFVG